jgi:hypothetical protein
MQPRTIASLMALQFVVACGYAVEAQDIAARPAYARSAAAGTVTKAEEDVTLRLTPRFVSAPGYVRSQIRVSPNAENRVMRVSIDSDGYYRSSQIELEGDKAPMTHWVDFKGVPAGKYQFLVEVLGPGGTARVTRQLDFTVLGMGMEP